MPIDYVASKQQALQLFSLLLARAKALHHPQVVQRLEAARTRLAEDKLLVVVCGEFKRGKSSLINALLEAPDLCPVDIDITTSLVTVITWAAEEQITVVLGEPGHEQTKQITRKDIADYVTEQGNPRNERQVQRLLIQGPFPPLKDGLVLVDTPGIGGLNTAHAAATYAILPEADVAVFVTDAQTPLTMPELEFVRDWLARCQHILCVVTKIDARPDYQTIVDDTRQKLAATLNRPGDTLTIVPVSSRLKLESLTSGDADDVAESNFAALEEALWHGLGAQAGPLLLLSALAALSQALTDLRTPLAEQRDVYQSPQPGEAEARTAEITAARERLKALQAQNAHWGRELHDGLSDLETALRRMAEDVFLALTGQMLNDLQDPALVRRPAKIVDRITSKLVALGLDLRSACKARATALQDKLKAMTELHLSAADKLTPPPARKRTPTLPTPRGRSFFRKAWEVLLAVWDVTMGLVLFWTLPRAITRLADTLKMTFQRETLSPAQIQARLQHFLSESQTVIRRDLEDMVIELRRSMRRDLEEQIQQDIERCNEILKSIAAASKVPPNQIGPTLAMVEQELKQLDALQQQVDRLVDAVMAGAEPTGDAAAAAAWGDFAE
jgi:GTPase Era involved in 16S rRNA processing